MDSLQFLLQNPLIACKFTEMLVKCRHTLVAGVEGATRVCKLVLVAHCVSMMLLCIMLLYIYVVLIRMLMWMWALHRIRLKSAQRLRQKVSSS